MTMRLIAPLLVLASALPLAAQEQVYGSCAESPLYSMLDFWVGNWTVHADGQLVGRNRIEKVLDGCAILEHWTGAGGGEGKSLFYVDGDGVWQQVWVTQWATRPGGTKEKTWVDTGNPDSVRFQGAMQHADSGTWLDRTTLTRLPDGTVRQRIEISTDGGNEWQVNFDAVYRRSDAVPH